jgi:hypothetical protein
MAAAPPMPRPGGLSAGRSRPNGPHNVVVGLSCRWLKTRPEGYGTAVGLKDLWPKIRGRGTFAGGVRLIGSPRRPLERSRFPFPTLM